MPGQDFGKQITAAARAVARIELRRRKLRAQLAELDTSYRAAQRDLRLLVQSVEPYEPPAPGTAAAAQLAAEERE